jgi:hypothetical protein
MSNTTGNTTEDDSTNLTSCVANTAADHNALSDPGDSAWTLGPPTVDGEFAQAVADDPDHAESTEEVIVDLECLAEMFSAKVSKIRAAVHLPPTEKHAAVGAIDCLCRDIAEIANVVRSDALADQFVLECGFDPHRCCSGGRPHRTHTPECDDHGA